MEVIKSYIGLYLFFIKLRTAVLTFLLYNQRQVSVVNEDSFARLDDLNNVLVVKPEKVLATLLLVLVVNSHRDRISVLYLDFCVHALHVNDNDNDK